MLSLVIAPLAVAPVVSWPDGWWGHRVTPPLPFPSSWPLATPPLTRVTAVLSPKQALSPCSFCSPDSEHFLLPPSPPPPPRLIFQVPAPASLALGASPSTPSLLPKDSSPSVLPQPPRTSTHTRRHCSSIDSHFLFVAPFSCLFHLAFCLLGLFSLQSLWRRVERGRSQPLASFLYLLSALSVSSRLSVHSLPPGAFRASGPIWDLLCW